MAEAHISSPESTPSLVGSTFHERYEVIRSISTGGMRAVYEAMHLETRRRCALEVMLPSLVRDPRRSEPVGRRARKLACRYVAEMRIVAVADTHSYQDALTVPDGDVFVHAGDLLRGGSEGELIRVAAWIRGLPHRHKIVVAGNHDWCFSRERDEAVARLGPEVRYLEDSAVTLDGVRFWGSPWQPEFFGWAFNLERGAPLRAKWALIPADTDVLVTHGPPRGFGDRTGRDEAGCDDLLAAVRRVKPRLHLFGHIHEDGGVWTDGDTVICNATTWECERGATVVDLDLATKRVTPVVVPPKKR